MTRIDIRQLPELLQQYFRETPWERLIDAKTIKRAQSLLGTVRHLGYDLKKKRGIARFRVESQSELGRHYRVDVVVDFADRRFGLHCTCPVGTLCKHGVAAAMSIVLGKHLDTGPAPGTDGGQKALANPTVDEDLAARQNLEAWERWQRRPAPADPPGPPASVHPPGRINYILETVGRRLFVRTTLEPTEPMPGKPRAKGPKPLLALWNGRVNRTVVEAARLPQHEVAMLWRICNQMTGHQEGERVPMSGAEGAAVLADLLRGHTCRMFPEGPCLEFGAARTLDARWMPIAPEIRKLKAELAPPADLVDVGGPWFVDRTTHEIGPTTGLTSSQITFIEGLPPVHRRNDDWVGAMLLASPLSSGLPAPTNRPAVEVTGTPEASLRLTLAPNPQKRNEAEWIGHLWFRYSALEVPDDNRSRTVLVGTGHDPTQVVVRDPTAERAIRARVRFLGCSPANPAMDIHDTQALPGPFPWRPQWGPAASKRDSARGWLANAARLAGQGIDLLIPPELGELVLAADGAPVAAEARESTRPGWFDLELGIDVDGRRVSLLPILSRAFREIEFEAGADERADARMIIPLDDGRFISLLLSEVRRLCRPLAEWLEHLDTRTLALPVARADLLADLADAHVTLRGPETLSRIARALRGAWHAELPPEPKALNGELRPYQHAGMVWLDFLGEHGLGGVLADDMGLGKTLQVLAHLLAEKRKRHLRGTADKPALVVMPTSLVPNWQSEAARFAPTLKVLVLHGELRHGEYPRLGASDLVLTTYALLSRDIESLRQCPFSLVVFDEAQALKNAQTKGSMCARALVADRKLAMTGTPIENHLGELWALMDLVLPGLLGPQKQFTSVFRTPIEKLGDDTALQRLNGRIRPFVLRRTKSEVAAELPAKTMITTRIAIEGKQRDLYESLRLAMHERVRKAIGKRGLGASNIVVLDALLKLRQVCCDPALVKLPGARRTIGSAKREHLRGMLKALLDEGRKILLFSQFTEMLDLIEADLTEDGVRHVRLDGSTRDRATPVRRFQDGRAELMLISLKAGGTGLNLTAADTVIHYDPWWNPAVMRQAEDRAHRIGQDKPVFIYSLVCEDTVEDRILEMQEQKSELARAILEGGTADAMRFDEETLNALFAAPGTE